jgi:cholesterol transport system auxiliary component
MIKRIATLMAGVLLVACGGNVQTIDIARYDLGSVAGNWPGSRIPIATIDVQAASWLNGPAMYFRLAYAQPLRRQSYAESRWVAPPAELLERFLKRRIVFGQSDVTGAGCRLQLVLDELEQRYDDPQSSTQVLEVRALLKLVRGTEIVSKRVFLIEKPTSTATAGGGVAATRDSVLALGDDLEAWLEEIIRKKPVIVESCRAH